MAAGPLELYPPKLCVRRAHTVLYPTPQLRAVMSVGARESRWGRTVYHRCGGVNDGTSVTHAERKHSF